MSCREHMSTVGRQKCRSDPSRLNPDKRWSVRIELGIVNKKLEFLTTGIKNPSANSESLIQVQNEGKI